MRIWLMNHYATQMMLDQAGRHYWFAEKLKERGYEVDIFCASTFLKDEKRIKVKKNKYTVKKVNNIPFVIIDTPTWQGNGMKRVNNMLRFGINLLRNYKNYVRINGKPDIIIASSVHPLTMVAGIRIAKKLNVPCICEVRDLWPEAIFAFGKVKESSLLGRILVRGEHWIYKKADEIIFTKEGDTDYLKEKKWTSQQGGDINLDKCHYINNGIDIKSFNRRIEEEKLEDIDLEAENVFNIVYAGVIRPVNKIDNILDCAKLLIGDSKYADVKFLIYGDGSELERLRRRAKEEHIDNVLFKGFVERKYIPYVLSKSSVNLLNYTPEGYNWTRGNSSNKLFEYMASGKPIISTVKMGYSIVEKYECGIELESCTPLSLAAAIKELHDMDKEKLIRLGINGKNGAEEFDFNILTDRLEAVISKVGDNEERCTN